MRWMALILVALALTLVIASSASAQWVKMYGSSTSGAKLY